MEVFDYANYGDVKRSIHYLDRTIEFESGAFQVQKVGINPIETFELTYQGTREQIKPIEEFYLLHRKSEEFLLPYDGTNYTVRFTSDFNPTDTWGWSNSGKLIAKMSVTLTMRVVNI